jgi:hypothetical protein
MYLKRSGQTKARKEGIYWELVVRHEALFDRERMKEPLREAVAAVS